MRLLQELEGRSGGSAAEDMNGKLLQITGQRNVELVVLSVDLKLLELRYDSIVS